MPPPKRMTANPIKAPRYRPGKAATSQSSSEDSDADEASNGPSDTDHSQIQTKPPPKLPSANKVSSALQSIDLNARRQAAEVAEQARQAAERAARAAQEKEAGFATESESESDSASATSDAPPQDYQRAPVTSSDDSNDDSDSSDSSDSEPKLLRPVFLRAGQRTIARSLSPDSKAAAALSRRQRDADALVQERLARDAAERAAGRRDWDDDEEANDIDDTDDLEPDAERAAWIARELGRIQRGRRALEAREAEIAEVERRRGMSAAEREDEDKRHVDAQQEEKAGRKGMAHLAQYHHKGAFYQEDAKAQGLLARDLMGATFVDQANREILPEYMQVRDQTRVGKKGRTKYRDMKSEDTGRWGADAYKGRRGEGPMGDDRFRPDDGRPEGATGANASMVGEKRKPFVDDRVPESKRARVS